MENRSLSHNKAQRKAQANEQQKKILWLYPYNVLLIYNPLKLKKLFLYSFVEPSSCLGKGMEKG
ncbi:hypothetical protein A7K93_02505 [Candidatus Methylacidiphilum fumarolicum]|nr:hypothetical protein A7K73_00700 [Candidatus Methylacidiphilum fumarolicum]TFE73519.1 hypothetical protein A7K72_06340 [Candidatus Methylacidiphilum fumarolicum]TFE75020.1 hypothetical protein A7K93_02505 [Candidatus Methylacidiphilum fumarolicum]TFE76566.1 hypothetical protein A7D33_09510 [Candidatus Methylacidiphilum fumarolicum]